MGALAGCSDDGVVSENGVTLLTTDQGLPYGDDEKSFQISGLNEEGCITATVAGGVVDRAEPAVLVTSPGASVSGGPDDFTITLAGGEVVAKGERIEGGGAAFNAGLDTTEGKADGLFATVNATCGSAEFVYLHGR